MIVVIADDFTGAAELAGISFQYGLNTELYFGEVPVTTKAGVLVICTDTRSKTLQEALIITSKIVKDVLQLRPSFIYKKIDSLLRGHIIEELQLEMQLLNKTKALIMPANPSLNRVIKHGNYYINDLLISDTEFKNDPDFPFNTSNVVERLGKDKVQLHNQPQTIWQDGIFIGNCTNADDIILWGKYIVQDTYIAGAGDFFNDYLKKRFVPQQKLFKDVIMPFLYVSGTSFNERNKYFNSISPEIIKYLPEQDDDSWMQACKNVLQQNNKLIIAINANNTNTSLAKRKTMASIVAQLVKSVKLGMLFIEGGSTAAEILAALKLKHFRVVNIYERGVVVLQYFDLLITVKPGSYTIPIEIKSILEN